MQEHVYNICDILSVLRLKTCKRRITPTTHTERRTLRSTHTPLTEHRKRSNLERMRSKRRRRAAAVYPPPCLSIERSPAKRSNPPPHPRLPPNSMKLPPRGPSSARSKSELSPARMLHRRAQRASTAPGCAPSRSILPLLQLPRTARRHARVHSGRKSARYAPQMVCLPRRT